MNMTNAEQMVKDMKATQALTILQTLQALPPGTRLDMTHCMTSQWHVACSVPWIGEDWAMEPIKEHYGADLVDCLAQLCQTLNLE